MAAVLPRLVQAGVEMHLAVLTDNQGLIPEVSAAGVQFHDLSGRSGLSTVRAIRSLIHSVRPDLVHATLFQASVPTQLAAIGTRVPVLVTWANTPTHGSTELVADWKLQVVHMMDLAFARLGSVRFHAVTEGVARTKANDLKVSARRVMVAERGRDPEQFQPPGKNVRQECRAALGVSDQDRVFLAVGRQEPQKGYADLVAAFDRVASSDDRAHLFIAGRSGSGWLDLVRSVEGSTNGRRIHLLGHCDDVVPLLAAADVMVCASHREGAAGALIEAMGCGVPIVTVDLDGLRGVLDDGVTARVVPRAQLADAMLDALDDPEGARRRAGAALELFSARFTDERSAESLRQVYEWAARGGASPRARDTGR